MHRLSLTVLHSRLEALTNTFISRPQDTKRLRRKLQLRTPRSSSVSMVEFNPLPAGYITEDASLSNGNPPLPWLPFQNPTFRILTRPLQWMNSKIVLRNVAVRKPSRCIATWISTQLSEMSGYDIRLTGAPTKMSDLAYSELDC